MDAPAGLSIGERVLGDLLEVSHRLRPERVPAVGVDAARRLGARSAALYVVDLEQRALHPLSAEGDPLDIDGTVAGRAFRTATTARTDIAGGIELWIPMLDGADRVGVLRVEVASADEVLERRLTWLASLLAELIVSKTAYADTLVVARRTRPMTLAAELRWSLLPPLTYMNDAVEVAAILEPAYEVAGDAFDYSVSDGMTHVALFDAMGHGLEASRMSNLAMAAYRKSRRDCLGLVETYTAIDRTLLDQFGPERFVTGMLGQLDLVTGRLRLVTAGHPTPLLLRGGRVVGALQLACYPPMGLAIEVPTETEVALEPGDRVLFFTDGVIEARSPEGEEFGVERLIDLLERAASAEEIPAEMLRRLTHRILEHEAADLRDDTTILLLGWKGAA